MYIYKSLKQSLSSHYASNAQVHTGKSLSHMYIRNILNVVLLICMASRIQGRLIKMGFFTIEELLPQAFKQDGRQQRKYGSSVTMTKFHDGRCPGETSNICLSLFLSLSLSLARTHTNTFSICICTLYKFKAFAGYLKPLFILQNHRAG